MHRVRTRVARALRDLVGGNRADHLRLARVGLGIDHINARGSNSRHNEIAPLHMGMRGKRAEGGTAGVPSKMMQLVTKLRQSAAPDFLAKLRRNWIDIDDED